jgi:hypothetical protein
VGGGVGRVAVGRTPRLSFPHEPAVCTPLVIGVRLGRVRVFGCRTDEASRFEGLVDGDDRDVSQRYASPTLRAPFGEGGGGGKRRRHGTNRQTRGGGSDHPFSRITTTFEKTQISSTLEVPSNELYESSKH